MDMLTIHFLSFFWCLFFGFNHMVNRKFVAAALFILIAGMNLSSLMVELS